MIVIAGKWDLWENPQQEYLTHWRFMTKHFGVDALYMTPITKSIDTNVLDSTETTFFELPTYEDVIKANPGLTPVIIDENGKTSLKDFSHPEDALYLFGRTGYSAKDVLSDQIISVSIPSWSKNKTDSLGLLHPHQAASIILYDRMNKQTMMK
jgi:tRNA(Leu) C34 or U34 (ribose-2'-O)-methylase TrmL